MVAKAGRAECPSTRGRDATAPSGARMVDEGGRRSSQAPERRQRSHPRQGRHRRVARRRDAVAAGGGAMSRAMRWLRASRRIWTRAGSSDFSSASKVASYSGSRPVSTRRGTEGRSRPALRCDERKPRQPRHRCIEHAVTRSFVASPGIRSPSKPRPRSMRPAFWGRALENGPVHLRTEGDRAADPCAHPLHPARAPRQDLRCLHRPARVHRPSDSSASLGR